MILKDIESVKKYVVEGLSVIEGNKSLLGVLNLLMVENELWLHSLNVAKIATQIALSYEYDHDDVLSITIGALLHDIGKLGIPSSILYKPSKLSDSEFAVIQTHPSLGVSLVEDCGLSPVVLDIIKHHHEKLNGLGYPDRLTEISKPVQIVTVADIFSALSENRCYHRGLAFNDVYKFIEDLTDINQDIVSLLPDLVTD